MWSTSTARLYICTCIPCCSIIGPAIDACIMRVRASSIFCIALIFVHIVFRVEETVGNSLENQLVKTECTVRTPSIISCPHRNVYCQTSAHPYVGKRCTRDLCHSLYLAPFRIASTYFWPSEPKPARNSSRLSDVCSWFWTFIVSEFFVISKMFSKNSIVGMILVCGSCTRSCDHCRVVERSNISLAFSPPSCFSSSFLLYLKTDAVSSSRSSLFVRIVDEKFQRLDKRFKMSNAMTSSILSVFRARCFLQIDSFVFRSLSRFFHAHLPRSC